MNWITCLLTAANKILTAPNGTNKFDWIFVDNSDCITSDTKFSNGARIICVCFHDVRNGSPSEESCGFYKVKYKHTFKKLCLK